MLGLTVYHFSINLKILAPLQKNEMFLIVFRAFCQSKGLEWFTVSAIAFFC